MDRSLSYLPHVKLALVMTLACLSVVILPSLLLGQTNSERLRDEISFSNDIQPIVENFCTTCHAGKAPDGEVLLTSYAEVRKMVEKGDLLNRINDTDDPMPPSGTIPAYMRRMFKTWARTGYIDKGKQGSDRPAVDYGDFKPPVITPVDLSDNESAFQLLEKMQGHWVGSMWLIGQNWDWMAFDFRAIEKSHIHGIFEGGTIGNLFTSFFVTNYKGKRTIMARNGGILNGIYRTSYFVLDLVEKRKNKKGRPETYYRLVDAYGGKEIMYMELTFAGESIAFNAYTSRMGLNFPAKPHMRFLGTRMHPDLSAHAAKQLGFPKNELDIDFSAGLPKPDWGSEKTPQTSASYLWMDAKKSIEELGKLANDPYPINKMPHLAKLTIAVDRNENIREKPLLIYLSNQSLTYKNGKFITQYGYLKEDVGNSILMFPEITGDTSEFTFTYLHPGDYFLTVIADMNGDSMPTPGDITSTSKKITVQPKSNSTVTVSRIEVQN